MSAGTGAMKNIDERLFTCLSTIVGRPDEVGVKIMNRCWLVHG